MTRPEGRAAAAKAAYKERKALWIATLNVCTLGTGDHVESGLTRARRIADELDVGVLFVQKTRLTAMNVSANKSAARKKGWKLTEGFFAKGSDGRACGGVAVLARWPASKVDLPKIPEDATTPLLTWTRGTSP